MKQWTIIFWTVMIVCDSLKAQQSNSDYITPNKKKNFSQVEWLEIMSDMANDPEIMSRMKGLDSGIISLKKKPYICFVNEEYQILIGFCPECRWTIDSCVTTRKNVAMVSLTADTPYSFHLTDIIAQDMWNPGDTVASVLYVVHTPPQMNWNNPECYLIPVVSNIRIPSYPVFPDPLRRKKKK